MCSVRECFDGSDMEGSRGCHSQWSKSGREREISYNIIYRWNLKITAMEKHIFFKREIESHM